MTLVKPGKLGPNLIPVSVGDGCTDSVPSGTPSLDAKPVLQLCGSFSLHRTANGETVFQSNKTTMALLASSLPTVGVGALGRPVVERTDLPATIASPWSSQLRQPGTLCAQRPCLPALMLLRSRPLESPLWTQCASN
jgi:hypothetical protein